MPQIGPLEILIVTAIALIVFGPDKLPGIARSVGRAATELRRMASEVTDEFKSGLDDEEEPPRARPAERSRSDRRGPTDEDVDSGEEGATDAKTDGGGQA
jgi:Tat protein translocase TatB subunit